MPSAITINVSAGAGALVSPAAKAITAAPSISVVAQDPGQAAKLSEQAVIVDTSRLGAKVDKPRIQYEKRAEPSYGPSVQKRKAKKKGETGEDEAPAEQQNSNLDLKA